MKAIFVSGTDTGVGKTVITGCLARYCQDKGYRVITQKWIQTGSSSLCLSDIRAHLKIMGKTLRQIKGYSSLVLPYCFKTACSPHLAAKLEQRKIYAHKIISSFKMLAGSFDFVIVEGVGGALVPFSRKHLVIDIVKGLNLPVLLVAENRLGAVNHTLLTIEALRRRKINILGLVFNELKKEKNFILQDNPRIIKALTQERIFGRLGYRPSYEKIYQAFVPIADKVWKAIK